MLQTNSNVLLAVLISACYASIHMIVTPLDSKSYDCPIGSHNIPLEATFTLTEIFCNRHKF